MNKPIQMYIITAPCWKCNKDMNVAVIKGDKKRHALVKQEAITNEDFIHISNDLRIE